MNRLIHRTVPDAINPFMPPRGMDPMGLRDDSHPTHVDGTGAIGTAGSLRENAGKIGTIFMLTGGILGSLAMYKGAFMVGGMLMGAGLIGGAIAEGFQEKKAA